MPRFTRSFHVFTIGFCLGYINLPSLKADYPWEALPADTTFVDVGAGQGTVSLHALRMLYDKRPMLRVVLQDRPQHLQEGEKYWAQHLPKAIRDERVEFQPHDFFQANPQTGPNMVYWFRFIMHDWTDRCGFALVALCLALLT